MRGFCGKKLSVSNTEICCVKITFVLFLYIEMLRIKPFPFKTYFPDMSISVQHFTLKELLSKVIIVIGKDVFSLLSV